MRFLVFGASGAIGSACAQKLRLDGLVEEGSRDLLNFKRGINRLAVFDGVVWAQGVNVSDSPGNFEVEKFENVMRANVTFILNSLKILMDHEKLKKNSQIVVLSSVWGHVSRPSKLSYVVSKSAVGGLVRSLAVELGPMGIHINSVSPGPINSPMTQRNLHFNELNRIIAETPIKRLVTIEEVTSVVCGLATGKFRGITGQDIVIDGGWSVSKLV